MNCYRRTHFRLQAEELKLTLPYQHNVLINEISRRTFSMYTQISLNLLNNEEVLYYLSYLKVNLMKYSVYLFYKDMDSIINVIAYFLRHNGLNIENKALVFYLLCHMSGVPFIFGKYLQPMLPDLSREFPQLNPMSKKDVFRIFFNLDLLSETKSYYLALLMQSVDEPQLIDQLCWGIYIYSKNPEIESIYDFSRLIYNVARGYQYSFPQEFSSWCPERFKQLLNSIYMLIQQNLYYNIMYYDLQEFLLSMLRSQTVVKSTLTIISYYLYEQRPFNLTALAESIGEVIIRFQPDVVASALEFLTFCQGIDTPIDCTRYCRIRLICAGHKELSKYLEDYLALWKQNNQYY